MTALECGASEIASGKSQCLVKALHAVSRRNPRLASRLSSRCSSRTNCVKTDVNYIVKNHVKKAVRNVQG
jgi:hypothetical protein